MRRAILFLALLLALNWTFLFVQACWHTPHAFDFGAFYRSGAAWNAGVSAYQDPWRPNLNPPWLLPLVFGPLARLPIGLALALWSLFSAVACWWACVLIGRTLGLSPAARLRIGVALALTYSWLVAWEQGQITWILLALVTQAWVWARAGQAVRAGVLLGMVVAIKPTMAVAAVPLGWTVLLTAGLTSSGVAAGSLLWVGLQPWLDWQRAIGTVHWYGDAPNASLAGELMRLAGTAHGQAAALAGWPAVVVPVVAVLMLGWSARPHSLDQRWAMGLLQAVILSPLGWTFYLPLALGPLLAVTRERRGWLVGPWALLVLQNFLQPVATLGFSAWGALGCAAGLIAWLGAAWPIIRLAPSGDRAAVRTSLRLQLVPPASLLGAVERGGRDVPN